MYQEKNQSHKRFADTVDSSSVMFAKPFEPENKLFLGHPAWISQKNKEPLLEPNSWKVQLNWKQKKW